MIVVTGAAGFIGSCMVGYLLKNQFTNVVAVDDFSVESKTLNHIDKEGILRIDRREVFNFIKTNAKELSAIIHLGARTDTVDPDPLIFLDLNIDYSKQLFSLCSEYDIPFIYASSAATYGDGVFGFDDDMEDLSLLKPLNEYGRSKHLIDEWILEQADKPSYWVGLKFFNVYGPNEYHKGRMASVIFHAYNQIQETGQMRLFRSHRSDFEDGMQLRDFIYVKDVCGTIMKLLDHEIDSGIYNLGTGSARSFIDLVNGVFNALEIESKIAFIDIPVDIRENYQYFTEAKMDKLHKQIPGLAFSSLEEGVSEYVKDYLVEQKYF